MPDRNEQAIISGFAGEDCAINATQELEKIGVIDLKIDHVDYLPAPEVEDFDTELAQELSSFETDVILTVVLDDAKVEQAEAILKKYGARF